MRHLYARAVRSMDDWLARVLEVLERAGVLDDTVVLVTSDHGENLGEGELIGHALSLDDRLIRVPFVSSHPLGLDDGHVLNLTELPRLVAALTDLDDHPWGGAGPAQEVTVAQLDPMGGGVAPQLLQWIAEWDLDEEGRSRLTLPATAATDGRWKLVRRGDEERLFDLDRDPLELHPLDGVSDHTRLGTAVDAAVESRPVEGWTAASPGPTPAPDASPEELERLRRQMEVLGYL
jgi:arylsulfatase A-like enzyme